MTTDILIPGEIKRKSTLIEEPLLRSRWNTLSVHILLQYRCSIETESGVYTYNTVLWSPYVSPFRLLLLLPLLPVVPAWYYARAEQSIRYPRCFLYCPHWSFYSFLAPCSSGLTEASKASLLEVTTFISLLRSTLRMLICPTRHCLARPFALEAYFKDLWLSWSLTPCRGSLLCGCWFSIAQRSVSRVIGRVGQDRGRTSLII